MIRFFIKIYNKNGKEVISAYSKYQRRMLYRLNRYFQRGFKCFLKVVYASGYQNEGEYSTKKDALLAYRCFAEKSLLDEFR